MMTNEPMPQGEAKLPITRKMCVQAVKQTYREGFPCFYWIGNAMMTVFVMAVACLLFIPPYWPVNLFGVVWLIVNWCLGLGAFFSHVLALFGICNVAKDVLRGKFTRKDTKGQVLYYWFRFTYHSPKVVDKHTYETAQAGEIFYMLSVPGLTYNETVAIYPISQYEWTGNSSKIKDYTQLHAAQDQTEERVENTILARRPLTRGRKWRLTDEEIARDLLESRALTKEHVLGAFVATAVLGGLLLFIHATAAIVMLAGGGVVALALLAQYLWFSQQVKKRSFIISSDTLMDKDPVKRGLGKNRQTRYVLGFRKHRPYVLPPQDESVYHDAELGDTFYIVRFAGKKKTVRAVYNALDVEVENDDQ